MNSLVKKIGTTIVSLSLVAMIVPGAAQAVTVEELTAQIAALTAQLAQLQVQLATLQGQPSTGVGVPAACTGVTFDRNLSQGMSGNDIKCLQALLNQAADTQVAASGAGSPGNETTYFGPLTKAAVIKFQEKYASEILSSWGLTAGTGFAGSTTRAKLNSILSTGVPTTPGVPTLPTAPGLTVSLASDNPVSATVVTDDNDGAQALIPFLKLNLGTPAGTSAKVTTLKVKRLGISNDSDIANVYLYEGDTKLAEMSSLSSGIVTFTNSAGLFSVSGTKAITVKGDLATTTSGKTIGFGVNASTDITTDASAINGTFPINGNLMGTAVVTDLGKLQVATSTNAATIDPGTNGFEAMRFTLAASNQKIKVYSLKFLQMGSINASDIANLSLWAGSTQIGSTVANLASDRTVTFDLSSAPYEIDSGVTRTISLKVDVIGGSTRTIQFSIQRSADVAAMDANYNVYIRPYTGSNWSTVWTVQNSVSTSVNSGNLVISKRSDSPSGNVTLNGTNITLAKYDIKAVGEDVKVSSLKFKVASTSGTWTNLKNGRLVYDGSQIGTTQNQVTQGISYTLTVNFTVPLGQTKVLEIRADIQNYSGTDLGENDALQATLEMGTSNAQRMVSLGTFNFPSADQAGNALTVSSAGLSATKNLALGDISTVRNRANVLIGSYLMTAGAAEGVDVSKITFKDAASSTATSTSGSKSLGAAFTNLTLYYGNTQLGSTVVPNTSDAPGQEYNFYPSPALSLAAGQQVRLDLKADVIASTSNWTDGNATQLSSAEGTGKVTSNPANFVAGVAGQELTLTNAGTIIAAVDASTPETAIVAMASTEQIMGIWKLSSGPLATPIEDLTVYQVIVYSTTSDTGSSANVKNLKMYCGDTQFGITKAGLVDSTVDYVAFSDTTNPCVIPKGGSKLFTLKADVPTFAEGSQAGQYNQFFITVPADIDGQSSNSIIARGAGDYAETSGSAVSYTANKAYPYRASLTASLACYGGSCTINRATNVKVASLTLSATGEVSAQLRAALQVDDETVGSWTATNTSTGTAAVAQSGSNVVDGTYSIRFTEAASSTANDGARYDFGSGAGLQNYSKLSFWITSNAAKAAAGDIEVRIATSTAALAATSTCDFYSNVSTLLANDDTYVEISLTGQSLSSSSRYLGFMVGANGDDNATWDIDAIKLYNDSITIDIANATDTAATATPFYLKTSGGTTKATGYYQSDNDRVTLVPDSQIDTNVTLDLVTNTNTLLLDQVASVIRSLTLSIDLHGSTRDSAGDFRWYDQAIAATSPITWLNGASPISIVISAVTGG